MERLFFLKRDPLITLYKTFARYLNGARDPSDIYLLYVSIHRLWLIVLSIDLLLVIFTEGRVEIIDRGAQVLYAATWYGLARLGGRDNWLNKRLDLSTILWTTGYFALQWVLIAGVYPTQDIEGFIGDISLSVVGMARMHAMLVMPLVVLSWCNIRALIVFPVVFSISLIMAAVVLYNAALFGQGLLSYILLICFGIILLSQHMTGALRLRNQQLQETNNALAKRIALGDKLAAEKERSMLSQELHDTLANSLSLLLLQLEASESLIDSDIDQARIFLRRSKSIAQEGIHETRNVLKMLQISDVENLGLQDALYKLGAKKTNGTPTVFHLEFPDNLCINVERSHSIYRIVQEGLTNVIKHAQANDVWVRFTELDADCWQLEIRDNGIGFDLGHSKSSATLGIQNLRERVQMIGGNLKLTSALNVGTTVLIEFHV